MGDVGRGGGAEDASELKDSLQELLHTLDEVLAPAAGEVHVAAHAASQGSLPGGPSQGTTVVRELEMKKAWEWSIARAVFNEWRGSVERREAVDAACVFLETERCSVVERRAFRAWSVQSIARTWAWTSPAAKRMDAHPSQAPLEPASRRSRELAPGIALVASPRRGVLAASPRRSREPRAPGRPQNPAASQNHGSSASILTEAEKQLLVQFRDASVSASGRESATPTRGRGRAGTSQDWGTPKGAARRDGGGAARSRSQDPRGWSSVEWGGALPDARALYERALRTPLKPPRPPAVSTIPAAVAGAPSGGDAGALEGAGEAGCAGAVPATEGVQDRAAALQGAESRTRTPASGSLFGGQEGAPAPRGGADDASLLSAESTLRGDVLEERRGASLRGAQDASLLSAESTVQDDTSLRGRTGGEDAQVSGAGAAGREGRRAAQGGGEVQGGGGAQGGGRVASPPTFRKVEAGGEERVAATPARVRRGRDFVKAGRASSMERRIEEEIAALTVQLRDVPRRARAAPRQPLDAHVAAPSRASRGDAVERSDAPLPAPPTAVDDGGARSEMSAESGGLSGRGGARAVARTLRLSRTDAPSRGASSGASQAGATGVSMSGAGARWTPPGYAGRHAFRAAGDADPAAPRSSAGGGGARGGGSVAGEWDDASLLRSGAGGGVGDGSESEAAHRRYLP
ncbi:hypothetical protein T484DRAFT_1767019, partial [Baffinella frigidus]